MEGKEKGPPGGAAALGRRVAAGAWRAGVRACYRRGMTQTLLLDLDGTLTDPRPGILACIRHALEGAGVAVPPEAALTGWIGPPLLDSLRALTGEEALALRCQALYRERFAAVGYRENAVYPGIPEALARLRAEGWRLLLATSKPLVFARQVLEHFALTPLLDGAYGAGLDGSLSDKRDLLAAILGAERLEPGHCLMVGDRAHDARGAAANGLDCLGVLYGYGSAEELRGAGALALVDSPAALPAAAAAWAAQRQAPAGGSSSRFQRQS